MKYKVTLRRENKDVGISIVNTENDNIVYKSSFEFIGSNYENNDDFKTLHNTFVTYLKYIKTIELRNKKSTIDLLTKLMVDSKDTIELVMYDSNKIIVKIKK